MPSVRPLRTADPTCRGSVAAASLNATAAVSTGGAGGSVRPVTFSYAVFPSGDVNLKLMRLGLTKATAATARVCIDLQPSCASLQTLCRGPLCRYASFSEDKTCCPVGRMNPLATPTGQ